MKKYLLPLIATNLLLINSVSVIALDSPQIVFLSQKNTIDCDKVAQVQKMTGNVMLKRPNQKERLLQKNDFLCRNDKIKIDPNVTVTFICNNKPTEKIDMKQTTEIICKEGCRYIPDKGCTRGNEPKIAQAGKPNIIFPKNDSPLLYKTKFTIQWDKVDGATEYIVTIKRFRDPKIWTKKYVNNQIEYDPKTEGILEPGISYDLIVTAVQNNQPIAESKIKFFIEKTQ